MTREEMVEMAREIRSRDAFEPVSLEELDAYGVNQRKLEILVSPRQDEDLDMGRAGETGNGRKVIVYELRPMEGLENDAALIINFHGGGFIKGRADRDRLYCSRLARELTCLVWDVDYCLAPEDPFPGAVHDCYGVAEYAFRNGKVLGVDPSRIFLAGHSAGGNLAAAVCLMAGKRKEFRPCGALMEYFPADFTRSPLDRLTPEQQADERMAARARMGELYNLFYTLPDQRTNPLASPLLASEEALACFPPSLIISAGMDDLRHETEEMARRLGQARVPATFRRFKNSPHGFTINRRGEWEEAVHLHLVFMRYLLSISE